MNKKITAIAILALGSFINMDVCAARPGVYAEANGGVTTSTDHSKLAFSADLGYQFNRHFGIELGYSHFPDNQTGVIPDPTGYYSFSPNYHRSYNNYFTDLALKASVPIAHRLSLFGKLGVAYANYEKDYLTYDLPNNATLLYQNKTTYLEPFLAAGISYKLNPAFDLNAQIQGVPTPPHQSGMAAALVGLTYHFN